MEKRAISIRIESGGGSRPVEWTLSGLSLAVVAGALFLLVATFGFLLTRVGDLAKRAEMADRLGLRNAELEARLQKVLEIEQELAALQAMDREIRSWAGLVPDAEEGPASGSSAASGPRAGDAASSAAPGRAAAEPLSPDEAALLAAPSFEPRDAGVDIARLAQSKRLRWPIRGWISSEFRELRAGESAHSGIDIVAAHGSPVVAAAAGRVVVSGSDPEYGRVVAIDHGNGFLTLYGHNAALAVRRGDAVAEADTISSVGSTGQSSAPHLHFEVRQGRCALDPRLFLPEHDGGIIAE